MSKQTNASSVQRETDSRRSCASPNWFALQKTIRASSSSTDIHNHGAPRKRQKLPRISNNPKFPTVEGARESSSSDTPISANTASENMRSRNDNLLDALQKMIFGRLQYTPEQQQTGKYLAIDCEMVGIGTGGSESSLGRVSIVNYYGAVQLDEFVKQREKVVDYRTQHSGIRAVDMTKARPFEEVQEKVAKLLKDKVVVGHAIHNDLKALLLSHPRSQLRDTQVLAGKFKLVRSKYIALRNLVKQELKVTIQSGEHSSVVDARAAMAIYRLHRKEWEKRLLTITLRRKEAKA